MADIYRIINKINGKRYIGYTSKDYKIRFRQHIINARYVHKNKKNKKTILNKAIYKYGEENFMVEKIMDVCDKCWKTVEQLCIEYENTTNIDNGYNMTKGGDLPPKTYGQFNVQSHLSDVDYKNIILDLKNYEYDITDIANKYNVHCDTVYRINGGKIRHDSNMSYPIRDMSKNENKANVIVSLLVNYDLNYEEISILVNCKRTTVMEINNGHTQLKVTKNLKFPIREHVENEWNKIHIDKRLIYKLKYETFIKEGGCLEIIEFLINSNLNLSQISRIFKVDPSKISRINSGDFSNRGVSFLKYPINKNKDYNKNILTTIKAVETIPLIGE